MEVMEIDDADDIDDDWFYESIRRYKTLQMFYLQNIPEQLVQISPTSICVGSKNWKATNTELLELELPAKLMLPTEEEGRSKGNDFRMLSGLYTNKPVYKLDNALGTKRIITSEFDASGLQVYTFVSDDSDTANVHNLGSISWKTPDFTVSCEKRNAVCSKCNHEPLILMDLNVGGITKEIKHPFHTLNILPVEAGTKTDPCGSNNIDCQFLKEDLLGILNVNSGCLVLHDLRSQDIFSTLPEIEDKRSKQFWTLSSFDYTSGYHFGMLSNFGHFYLCDIRNHDKFVMHQRLDLPESDCRNMKLKFSKDSRFSVSGFDSNVRIYNIEKGGCELVFNHNGHAHGKEDDNVANGSNEGNFITDHIWLSSVGDNFLISVCDNKSLNCWEYC